MATAELAVAKASLSATLFRADPVSCSRDDMDSFFSLLGLATTQCSPINVQKCKHWILANLVQSSNRVAPFAKYLSALANSFVPGTANGKATAGPGASLVGNPSSHEPSAKRKRLHVLYILNDVFYHTAFRGPSRDFITKFAPFLAALVRAASSFPGCPKHIKKLHELITIWEEKGYFDNAVIQKLRAAVDEDPSGDPAEDGPPKPEQATAVSRVAKEHPFIMPAMHGDPATPWYDLPAANWLPSLEPNSTRPMNSAMIKPLQLAPGPADKTLVEAVKKLLVDVDKIYAKGTGQMDDAFVEIDQMGERVELDEINGGIIDGETYYGWSRAFCEKMKARRRKKHLSADSPDRRGRSSQPSSRSSSRSPSRHGRRSSRAATKRRRMSATWERSPDRGGGRGRRRSPSRDSYTRRSWSRSRSASRPGRETGPPGRREESRGRSPSPHYSPPPALPAHQNGTASGYPHLNQPAQAAPFGMNPFPPAPALGVGVAPPMMPPHQAFAAFQPPVAPPPPVGYKGQWPPPPPPPLAPAGGVHGFYAGPNAAHVAGGWVPQPPPPPQEQQQQWRQGSYQHNGGRDEGAFPPDGRGRFGRGGW